MNRKYVAVIEAYAVRDTQFCRSSDIEPMSESWEDLNEAEIYLGIFTGTVESVLKEASGFASTSPDNIRLIDVFSDAAVQIN